MVMSLPQLIEAGYDVYIAYAILSLAVFGIITLVYFAIKFIIWLFKKKSKDAQQIIDEVIEEQDKKYNLSNKEIKKVEEKYEAEVKEEADEPDEKYNAYTRRMKNYVDNKY